MVRDGASLDVAGVRRLVEEMSRAWPLAMLLAGSDPTLGLASPYGDAHLVFRLEQAEATLSVSLDHVEGTARLRGGDVYTRYVARVHVSWPPCGRNDPSAALLRARLAMDVALLAVAVERRLGERPIEDVWRRRRPPARPR